MNKYQEAFNKLAYILEIYSIDIDDKDIKKVKDCLNILGELVDQTKTLKLEEIKKEWEEKGYEYYKGKNHIHFRYLNERGSYDEYIFHPTELYYVAHDTKVTFEMFQLISKTLKALVVENE